jgi:hypothetical protein
MKYLKITFVLTISFLLLVSCGSNKKQDENVADTFTIEDYIEAAESIEPDLDKVDQIFNILYMVHAGYYDVLTNDPYSAHSYKSSYPVAAANLGIYVADIVYHLYGEADESMFITFQAAQELAKHIGVQSAFGTWTLENLEGTMMKRDTITHLFNSLLQDSENYNSEKEMVFVHTAFLTGSFVEKVYISSNLLKEKMNDDEISKEEEGDIRKLLVIFLNQLDPSTTILFDAFAQQQDQLEGLAILSSFESLKELSSHLKEMKSTLSVAPISELASNEDLLKTFGLIADLRTGLITSVD